MTWRIIQACRSPTIGRLEATDSDEPIGGRPETGEALVAALEKVGVEFIPENGGGAAEKAETPIVNRAH
jgi:hypothetical protein